MDWLIGFLTLSVICMILNAVFAPLVEDIRRSRGDRRVRKQLEHARAENAARRAHQKSSRA